MLGNYQSIFDLGAEVLMMVWQYYSFIGIVLPSFMSKCIAQLIPAAGRMYLPTLYYFTAKIVTKCANDTVTFQTRLVADYLPRS